MLQQKESYDVLRLIEHGQLCYISSENVQGKTLDRYLKYHPVIKKREIFLLLKEIAGQLASFHRCRGNPCYQYVNPYSIVRSEDGRIYFLDMQSEANRSKMIFMQRRDIREYFLPPDEKYYQHASKELDMYGLGKTFQYILASVEAEPRFNRREEYRLQRIISKAMGIRSTHYLNVLEIQKQIPRYEEKDRDKILNNKGKRRKKVCITVVLSIVFGGYLFINAWENAEKANQREMKRTESSKSEEKKSEKSDDRIKKKIYERDEEYLELALAYFLNVGDMKKSLKCLNQMENQTLAVNLKRLIKAYEKQKVPEEAEKFAASLAYLENEWKERSMQSEEKKKQAIQCLIRGYGLLDDKESSEKVLNLVEEGLKTDYLNDSAKRELLQYQASALEKEEKKEEAANIYAEILEDETEPGKREELYKKMVQLYETAGRRDMASDTCIQGIKELGESEELKLTHIRLICADPAVNRDTCALKIKEYVTEDTELLENAEFKKLQKEYGIKAEGGNIWVGR